MINYCCCCLGEQGWAGLGRAINKNSKTVDYSINHGYKAPETATEAQHQEIRWVVHPMG